MRKLLYGISLVALVAVLAVPSLAGARDAQVGVQVNLAPLGRSHSPPPLGRRQGWLTISNRDWQPYTLVVSGKRNLSLNRGGTGYGGIIIPSGATVSMALERETYDLFGDTTDKLKIRVREGRTTTLSLEPFGYVGRTGLIGVANDGDRVRNATLYADYASVVVVPPPPTIIVNRPPPPPPPPIIVRPPVHRPPPPPPPRPGHGRPDHGRPGSGRPDRDNDDNWGFFFGIGKR